jgi:hypothetical protein
VSDICVRRSSPANAAASPPASTSVGSQIVRTRRARGCGAPTELNPTERLGHDAIELELGRRADLADSFELGRLQSNADHPMGVFVVAVERHEIETQAVVAQRQISLRLQVDQIGQVLQRRRRQVVVLPMEFAARHRHDGDRVSPGIGRQGGGNSSARFLGILILRERHARSAFDFDGVGA